MKPVNCLVQSPSRGVPQGESSSDWSVQSLSKFSTDCEQRTTGLNVLLISRRSSFSQLIDYGHEQDKRKRTSHQEESTERGAGVGWHRDDPPPLPPPTPLSPHHSPTHLEEGVLPDLQRARGPRPEPLCGVAHEQALEQAQRIGREELGVLDLALQDLALQRVAALVAEGRQARKHLIEQDARRPPVHLMQGVIKERGKRELQRAIKEQPS